MRHALWRMRNSKLPPENYAQIRGILCEADDLSGPVPMSWEQWGSALEQYGLDDRATMTKWRETIATLATLGFTLPMDLSRLDYASLMQLTRGTELGDETKQLWQACVLAFQEPDTRAVIQFTGASDEAGSLSELAKGADFNQTKLVRSLAGASGRLKLAKDFPKLGPAAKINALKRANLSRNKLQRFFEAGTRVNLLKRTRLNYKAFASGIRCFFLPFVN